MAERKGPSDPVDWQALMQKVHGEDDLSRRAEVLEAAVRSLEATHRHASLGIRNFERTGSTTGLPRTGALQAAAAALGATNAVTTDAQAPAAAAVIEAVVSDAVQSDEQTPIEATRTFVGRAPDAQPTQPAAQQAAVALSDEVTEGAAGAAHVTAQPAALPDEVTADVAPHSDQAARTAPAPLYSGRGADLQQRGGTKTHIIHRPKKK